MYRQLTGLTQRGLAARTVSADPKGRGLSGALISGYERSTEKPGPRELRLICDALGVTPNLLVFGDEALYRSRAEAARVRPWVAWDPELLAATTYCFGRLPLHCKEAILQLMVSLLRPGTPELDAQIEKDAVNEFLAVADRLRQQLRKKKR